MKPNSSPVTSANDLRVVKFTNIANFDFTPAMGAAFDGRPLFVKAGESKMMPYSVGFKIAGNLAKQILLRNSAVVDDSVKNPNGTVLWTDEKLAAVVSKIITEQYQEETPAILSHTDMMMHKIEDLNREIAPGTEAEGFKTKQDVVKALEDRKIKFNIRDSKAKLEVLLEEHENSLKEPGLAPSALIGAGDSQTEAPKEFSIDEIKNRPTIVA